MAGSATAAGTTAVSRVPPPGCDPDDFHFRADVDGPACEDYDVDMKDFWVLQRIIDGT